MTLTQNERNIISQFVTNNYADPDAAFFRLCQMINSQCLSVKAWRALSIRLAYCNLPHMADHAAQFSYKLAEMQRSWHTKDELDQLFDIADELEQHGFKLIAVL